MKAYLHQIRITSKKANLVASLVRGKKALEAVDVLKFTPKRTAPYLKKLIQSAIANAENNFKQKAQDLYIKEIVVTEGPTYKRSMPVSRGRSNPILKRTCHITVKLGVLESKEPKKAEKIEKETEKKPEKKAKKSIK